ncbi:uncharacterized protein DUF4190 [Isoptericola jiangsuensis]|uniref:Uncharacterized protein DUF4190 n=1 Tax=Isoptericola jiangsuensis TaxID=548579 RepID=A0A2A9EU32_9MICO|nr:DUF4190 domain-containing protein [Isoptericola jiangsuensis]PFG41800.1 uncharacterized protein DUF4190 [Isoptericola jiangsuensis]
MNVPPSGDPYAPQPASSGPTDAPPAPGSPAGPPPGYGAPVPTDGVSIGALVTGLLGLALIPVSLGIAGIVRTKDKKRRGRGLAIAGLVLGVLSTVVWGFVLAGAVFLATNQDAVADSLADSFNEVYQEQTGTDLVVGDCFEPPADLTSGDPLESADCATPHTAEAYEVYDLPDGDFPGMEAVAAEAQTRCLDAFAPYVGSEYVDSSLDVMYFHPTDVSWTFGDRRVVCGIVTMDGTPLETTVAGSAL